MEPAYSDTNTGLHYDLRLEVDPRTNFIAVSGSLAYHAPRNRLERARFYLNRQFTVTRLEGRRVMGYQFELYDTPHLPAISQAGVLDVYFNPPLHQNETALIQFDYHGNLSEWPPESANIISPDWVEMGLYLPWFPLQIDESPANLTFTLRVTLPAGYQAGSYGPYVFKDGAWFFNWPYPTSDIVVVGGQSIEPRVYTSEPNHVFLYTTTFSDASSAQLGEDMLWTLERFSGWFGPIRPTDFTLIESPRPLGGGYARRGLVVLAGLNERDYLGQREAYLRYLAHETAHAWWWDAPTGTWEDWLNESFAEYSALLAVRERFGQETFDQFLERKRERTSQNLSFWGFDRADNPTPEKQAAVEHLLYDKGPLLLNDLAEKIGIPRFLELCRARLWSGVITTEHLLDLLEEVENRDIRDWFEHQLKSGS